MSEAHGVDAVGILAAFGKLAEEDALQDYLRCAAAAESAHEWYLVAVSCERVAEYLANLRPPDPRVEP